MKINFKNGDVHLVIKCTHDFYAKLYVYKVEEGKEVTLYSCKAVIGKNGPGKLVEGDAKTSYYIA